jgi:hypothetical protein
MLRFDLKLLPLDEGASEAEAKIIADSNAAAKHSCRHLKKLLGNKRCRKHPSSPNKIRITAVKGGDPKAELMMYCCPEFIKVLK